MSSNIELMDLPDEILLEIVARVSFEASTWSNLSQVNQRFKGIMKTESLPAKAAQIQFPMENTLLPPTQPESGHLAKCKKYSEHLSRVAACLSSDKDIRKLISITVVFLRTKEIEEVKDLDHPFRVYFIHFSVLRLLPTEVHAVLRYFALKMYQYFYASDRILPLLGPEPQSGAARGQWLCDVSKFLRFEMTLTMPYFQELGYLTRKLFIPVEHRSMGIYDNDSHNCEIRTLVDGTYPILKADRFLPSPTALMEAEMDGIFYSEDRLPTLPSYLTVAEAENGTPEHVLFEFREQMRHTREVVAKIEAPDGQYVRDLLDNLDLKSMYSIVAQQAQYALTLSGDELREALAREVELVTE